MAPMPELRPHQKTALGKLKNGSILWGGVGSGKSRVGLAYYVANENGENVVVITTAKKRDSKDWEGEAAKWGIGKEKDASLYGTLTVDSWNNLQKYVDMENTFFIFDEQRLVGSGAWVKAFLNIAKKNPWIMLSATPGDTWLDYIPVFIANGFYKNQTQFKAEHCVFSYYARYPKLERYVNVQKLVRYRSQILVKMPYERQTVRHPINCWTDYDVEQYKRVWVDRWNIYDDCPVKEVGELFHILRKVVNSDRSRLSKLTKLLQEHDKIIVFYNFNYELDMIRELRDETALGHDTNGTWGYAEWNGQNHEDIPKTDRWLYVVQYVAGAEGWNCTETDTTVFWSLPYSYKLWEQAHGRTDRMDTPFVDLNYYSLRSKSPIDAAVWRSLKSKRNFQNEHYGMKNSQFAAFHVGS